MNSVRQRVERSLDALDAGRPLVLLVDELIREYPDPNVLANEHAQRILLKHTGKAIEPRFVWWHQFDSASSSSLSKTGWRHSGPPKKSMQLAELVIQRFDAGFQEAPDQLEVYGGFYRQGAHAIDFDERNEVPMLGSEVQQDLWQIDFAQEYRAKIARFWSSHGESFRVLAKVNLLGQARAARRMDRITEADYGLLRATTSDTLAEHGVPTLAQLRRSGATNLLSISRYALDNGDRGCIYSLVAHNGRVMLYMPWSSEALRGFASELAMAQWLRTQLQDARTFDAFAEAAYTDPRDASRAHAVKTHLRSIAGSQSDQAALVLLMYLKRPVSGDYFTHLASQAHNEMQVYAGAMQSNADLRGAMWGGYLAAFLKVFGGFAPLGWPMTLMFLGVSVAKVGLEVHTALHAKDDQTRQGAMREAMLDSLFAALNLADLGFQSSFASLSYEASQHELNASLDNWEVVRSASLPVEGQETNELLVGEEAQTGRLRGIRVDADGSCWIVLNGLSYRVRYSHELAVWLMVPPDNPFAYGQLYPVRLSETGEWELLGPPRLLGGGPPATVESIPSIRSPFWDTYTSVEGAKSQFASANALRRQKALLENWPVAKLRPNQVPSLDSRGLDCVMVEGRPYYTYRHDREYFNSLIEYYTSDESKVNDVFRSGTYRFGDEDDYIQELAIELGRLPKSNAVGLYRGGHRSRGTSGERFRSGQLRIGDVLVNTDLTSFTENPYKVIEFACEPSASAPGSVPGVFDDSSVVFELPQGHYHNGTPISPFSLYWDEGETLFLPGNYFRIDRLEQVYGEHYHFIHVVLTGVLKPATRPVYDLRTGLLFDPEVYRARLRTTALMARFFPS